MERGFTTLTQLTATLAQPQIPDSEEGMCESESQKMGKVILL